MGKPPPSRHVVPRRGTSDYDEDDATTLDPFSIHESELVRVPRKGGTDAIREDLKADPDVQDALRWLDPPSNAGPPAEVAAAAAMTAAPEPHVPPVRHPSAPAYPPQVYTPIPQPYPGQGPYPTPVPAYVPNSGAYYLATPIPQAAMPPMAVAAPRSPILWIILTALVTGGGIALGWWMFAGRGERSRDERPAAAAPATAAPTAPAPSPPAPTPTAPAPTPTPTPTPPAPTEPPPAPAPAAPASVTAEIASVAPSKTSPVDAPVAGTVSKLFLAVPGRVKKGDKLVEIRSESGGGSKARKLATRVAELERLAKDDPVYEEFLADARRAEKAARGSAKLTVVKAPAEGHARLAVKEGDSIAKGKPVAEIAAGGDWIVKATAKAEVLRSWKCSVTAEGGDRAPCKIDKVVASAAGSDITATVSPKDAPWLEDAAKKPALVLDPP